MPRYEDITKMFTFYRFEQGPSENYYRYGPPAMDVYVQADSRLSAIRIARDKLGLDRKCFKFRKTHGQDSLPYPELDPKKLGSSGLTTERIPYWAILLHGEDKLRIEGVDDPAEFMEIPDE